ncbi:MAG: tRNA pseudouridine(55) synthase TruB [Smithellaceae bacterium]|nr:tRNA pseudouridine(55) synthase TruB [Smithellaceae bacterium]
MDGIVVIDKPAGLTSHDVVSRVKKILGAKKAGHTGTLDPLATGVLPVCVGEATKLAPFLTADRKMYRATMLLGVETDTQDIQGRETGRSDRAPADEEIRTALGRLTGKIQQVPPAFSALKHKGRPLYKYARAGEFPDIAAREVEIFALEVKSIAHPYVTFEITCSKGTYIRTVCADAGRALGCGACLSGLRRLRSGCFTEEMAAPLEEDTAARKALLAKMLPMAQALPFAAAVDVSEPAAVRLRAGFQPDAEMMRGNVLPFLAAGDMIKFISPEGELVALAEMQMPSGDIAKQNGKTRVARMLRVFNQLHP